MTQWIRVQVSRISKHAKRFLFKISSATEFFLENKAMKLDFTLLFHMDVQALDIPTYIPHYREEYCLLDLSYRRSIQQAYYANAPEINSFKCKISGFYQYKNTTYSQDTAALQYSIAHFLSQSCLE